MHSSYSSPEMIQFSFLDHAHHAAWCLVEDVQYVPPEGLYPLQGLITQTIEHTVTYTETSNTYIYMVCKYVGRLGCLHLHVKLKFFTASYHYHCQQTTCWSFTFMGPCIVNVFKHNQQDKKLHNDIYYYKCSTCFRRFLHPSSVAQNCVHSTGYLSSFYCFLLLVWVSWDWFACATAHVEHL
jgi:hypothetical protein